MSSKKSKLTDFVASIFGGPVQLFLGDQTVPAFDEGQQQVERACAQCNGFTPHPQDALVGANFYAAEAVPC